MHLDRTSPWEQKLILRTKAANTEAARMVREDMENHPQDTGPLYTLMVLQLQALLEGWVEEPSRTIEEMVETGRRCRQLAPRGWGCHGMSGWGYFLSGDAERMLESFENSVELSQGMIPFTHAMRGLALAAGGRPEEGIDAIDRAIRLSPEDPALPDWYMYRAQALAWAGRYQESSEAAKSSLSLNRNSPFNTRAQAFQILAASSALLGRMNEARNALLEARKLRPHLSLDVATLNQASVDSAVRERYVEGLRMAGLEE